ALVVLHCPRAARPNVLPCFQRGREAPKRLASSCLGNKETTGSAPCSHSLPGTSHTKASETQFLGRPDLAEVGLLLWVCSIGLELKGPKVALVGKGAGSPQSILLPALWEAKKQMALPSAL
ncbi:hypothetical protein ABE44_05770, partial [Bacillus thuringiensis]|nr:hypothetical protein [Bacillus thuringiensis]